MSAESVPNNSSYLNLFYRWHDKLVDDDQKTTFTHPHLISSLYILVMSQSIVQCIMGPGDCEAST